MINYRLPFDFARLFESSTKNLERCSEEESIDQNLELLLTTCPGEHKYDPEFGCGIWELDFEIVVSMNRWENEFLTCISNAIKKYEPRITFTSPKLTIRDSKSIFELSGAVSIRKRVDIQIDAVIRNTGKKCCFYYSLYLGPLSTE